MEKQRTIPQLRFPEFNGDWEKKKIKELAEIKYGKDQKQILCEDGKYPIMGTGGEIGKTNVFLYDKPSVMIGRKGTIDKPRYMDTPFWTVDTLFYTEVFDDTDPKWLYYKFETINWYLYNEASGVPSLSSSTIYSIPITTPILPEQQKIASFFTAIDQKITQLRRKKTLLEQYKKGVMQKLFSQQIRFKDDNGKEFPKWEKLHGNEVFGTVSNKNHNSDLPILAITQEQGAVPRDMIDYYITVSEQSIESYKVVEKGDFIISLRSFQGGIEYSEYKGICSPAYIILRAIQNIDNRYFKYYFKTENYISELNRKLEGIRDGKMISFKYFSDIVINVPSLPEQTKIANFLSSIDNKIIHTQRQIEKAGVWKKGLMQQMFV